MPRFPHILFDLDGTLTDPAEGITGGIMYAREKSGLDPGKKEDYYKFIGPPMPWSFEHYWGMSPRESAKFLEYYREYYVRTGMFENRPYPGIEACLARLQQAGCRLYVATSKPDFMSVQILETFALAPYFTAIHGSDPNRRDSRKADIIRSVLDRFSLDKKQTVMVGDRLYDVEGARECALPCLGVTYGYGDREELLRAGADFIVDSVEEMCQFLLA